MKKPDNQYSTILRKAKKKAIPFPATYIHPEKYLFNSNKFFLINFELTRVRKNWIKISNSWKTILIETFFLICLEKWIRKKKRIILNMMLTTALLMWRHWQLWAKKYPSCVKAKIGRRRKVAKKEGGLLERACFHVRNKEARWQNVHGLNASARKIQEVISPPKPEGPPRTLVIWPFARGR